MHVLERQGKRKGQVHRRASRDRLADFARFSLATAHVAPLIRNILVDLEAQLPFVHMHRNRQVRYANIFRSADGLSGRTRRPKQDALDSSMTGTGKI